MKRTKRSLFPCFLAVAACSSTAASGTGTATFTTWGEEFIEEGIPADKFEDGWAVKFDKFFISIGNVKVADDTTTAGEMKTFKLFNHVVAKPKPVVELAGLGAKPWTNVSYQIAPVTAATELGEGSTEADKTLMVAGGYSLYVEGKATKGTEIKTFKWGFSTKTVLDRCKGEVSGKEVDGLVVTNGGTEAIELTIHGDHLFYDDLQDPEAKVRFQNLADADADKNGEITLAELEASKLARLPKPNGPYGTGTASDILDLKAYVSALTRTTGHYRGEGECVARAQ
jgi:hypothetical protein